MSACRWRDKEFLIGLCYGGDDTCLAEGIACCAGEHDGAFDRFGVDRFERGCDGIGLVDTVDLSKTGGDVPAGDGSDCDVFNFGTKIKYFYTCKNIFLIL